MLESPSQENVAKLHAAVSKMQELKANMAVLGKDAAEALAAAESEQEMHTFQRLIVLVCRLPLSKFFASFRHALWFLLFTSIF